MAMPPNSSSLLCWQEALELGPGNEGTRWNLIESFFWLWSDVLHFFALRNRQQDDWLTNTKNLYTELLSLDILTNSKMYLAGKSEINYLNVIKTWILIKQIEVTFDFQLSSPSSSWFWFIAPEQQRGGDFFVQFFQAQRLLHGFEFWAISSLLRQIWDT